MYNGNQLSAYKSFEGDRRNKLGGYDQEDIILDNTGWSKLVLVLIRQNWKTVV